MVAYFDRVRLFKLFRGGEDIVGNIMFEKDDLRNTTIGRGIIIDKVTGEEGMIVSFPVLVVNGRNITQNTNQTFFSKWIPQTDSGLLVLPYCHISTCVEVSAEIHKQYRDFIMGNKPVPTKGPLDQSLKIMTPEHPETC